MTRPTQPDHETTPAHQTGEDHGAIKQPQQTDRTMQDQNLARGSEKPTREGSN